MTSLSAVRTSTSPPGPGLVRLRLLATSDLHAHVLAHDYLADAPLTEGGLDRTAVLIARARAEVAGAILLDNGDFLHGTPLSEWAAEARAQGRAPPDPVIAAMNRLGFDAAALGNHEFDDPPSGLTAALAQARFPLLCANAWRADAGPAVDWPVRPWCVVTREVGDAQGRRHAVRVGVIGFLPPQTALWAGAWAGGALRVRGIVEAARAELPRLRAAGAEIVVALCHSGFEAHPDDAAAALAQVPGIDAIVCGHTHGVFPSPEVAPAPGVDPERGRFADVPAVMPGWRGSHLGVIDLDLAPRAGGGWHVAGARSQVRAVRDLAPEASGGLAREPAVAAAHAAALARMRQTRGRTAIRLTGAFASLGASSALDLVAAVKRDAAARALAGGPSTVLPLLVASAPATVSGRAGSGRFVDIAPGDLAQRHLVDLFPHANTLVVLRVTGAELRDWLERAAGRFARLPAGARDAALFDEAFPGYRFDVIYGLRYAFDLSRPARYDPSGREVAPGSRRVVRLERCGREVGPGDVFAVATKSHRVSGEGLYAPLAALPRIASCDRLLRALLAEHLAAASPLGPAEGPDWGFAPLPGATALFAAPRGAEPPADLRARVERIGPSQEDASTSSACTCERGLREAARPTRSAARGWRGQAPRQPGQVRKEAAATSPAWVASSLSPPSLRPSTPPDPEAPTPRAPSARRARRDRLRPHAQRGDGRRTGGGRPARRWSGAVVLARGGDRPRRPRGRRRGRRRPEWCR